MSFFKAPHDETFFLWGKAHTRKDIIELLSKKHTPEKWDEIAFELGLMEEEEKFSIPIMKLTEKSVEVKKGKRKNYENGLKKYKHTPKWYKKKNLQELKVALEYLKTEDSWLGKCVRCECY